MYTNSDNVVIMICYETDKIIEKLFKSLLERYQQGLEEKMGEGSNYLFDSVDLLHYRLHKMSLNRDGSHIDSPKLLKNKRAIINRKNKDDKCFQYAIKLALNNQKINNHLEEIYNITPFIGRYDWNEKKDWNKFEKNNYYFKNNKSIIALNVLFVPYNTEQIRTAYVSEHNSDRKKHEILLMNTDGKKWHYLFMKRLSALLKGITLKHVGDFILFSFVFNCFHSYTTENKLKQHENVCKNHVYFYVEMPKEDNKILKYNPGEKSMKVSFVIYADLEPLLEKISACHSNPKKSSTTKINKHTASGYSLFTCCSFGNTKNRLDYYRDQDCMKNFCKYLKNMQKT